MAPSTTSLVLAIIAAMVPLGMTSPACPAPSSKTTKTTKTTITASPDLPASCTYRPTATFYGSSGCDIPCATTPLCIADAIVTLPCGCSRMVVSPTTKTLCATKAPCNQCSTGWGFMTVTESNCPGATPTP